ncbi:MAG: 1-deoxy-D-xylulose-5-phosphate synthase N-terminal domain-containing protein, partial [Candidatus Limnocylindrus sp.]
MSDERVALRAVGEDSLLARLEGPAGLKLLSSAQLDDVAEQIRTAIIATTAVTGGHLGPSLGVVELTLALHRVMNSPTDRLVFDTGHQAYPHKLLTGRLARFGSLRQLGGIGGFPRRTESPHDVFDGGHAGTGLSIGQGLALARDVRGTDERVAVVVGDAALMSGLSLEALNDIGHRGTRLLIVLNDNEMSISPTVGAISTYLSRVKLSKSWRRSKGGYDRIIGSVPVIGPTLASLSKRFRRAVISFAQEPGRL